MDWWKELCQNKPLKNCYDIPEQSLRTLAKDFDQLTALEQEFPERLMRHIVDDDDDNIVSELMQQLVQEVQQFQAKLQTSQQAMQAGQVVQPPVHPSQYFQVRRLIKVFKRVAVDDIDFYERLTLPYFDRTYLTFQPMPVRLTSSAPSVPTLVDRIYQLLSNMSYDHRSDPGQTSPLTISHLEKLLMDAGESVGVMGRLIYQADPSSWSERARAQGALTLSGVVDYTRAHADIVTAGLQQSEHSRRLLTLQMLQAAKVFPKEHISLLVDIAVGTAKTEREAATQLLQSVAAEAISVVKTIFEDGKATERHQAVKLLWELQGDDAKDFLQSQLANEKSKKVQAAIDQILAVPEEVQENFEASTILPPLAPVKLNLPFPEKTISILEDIVEIQNQGFQDKLEDIAQRIVDIRHRSNSNALQIFRSLQSFCTDDVAEELSQSLWQQSNLDADIVRKAIKTNFWLKHQSLTPSQLFQSLEEATGEKQSRFSILNVYYRQHESFHRKVREFFAYPDTQLIHAVKLLMMCDYIWVDTSGYRSNLFRPQGHELLEHYYQHHPDYGGLRELAIILEAVHISPDRIAQDILGGYSWSYHPFLNWENDLVWPYFAERLPLLIDALNAKQNANLSSYVANDHFNNALKVLTKFPHPPAEILPRLWDLALSGPKTQRSLIQGCLNPVAQSQAQILTALKNTDREIRSAAADWLADRGETDTIEPLKVALRKEKSEATKDVLLRSLERLGASVDEFFDRKNLLAEAEKILKKKLLAGLTWFPFKALPTVRWQDTNKAVQPEILKSFIVQCVKQKKIDPGPILKRHVALWNAEDRVAFGEFILTSWITQDVLPMYTPEEADDKAIHQAKITYQQYQHYLKQYPQSPYYIQTYEDLYRGYFNEYSNQCKGSAIKEKGVLALAAACCDATVVPTIHQYLKRWYGLRSAQGKALLQVLSWIDDNTAIQLLLSVANRFRTKGLQKYAAELVDQLAERNQWTRDELADRTMPTAGLDEQGQTMLDYGSRQFTLQLDSSLALELRKSDGKVIKSLPKPRQSDDEDLAKAAKKQLTDARKQLKQVVTLQKSRLYEAMCTQRSWCFDDWQQYLNQHPIVRYYCQRLVWVAYEGKSISATFRPLEDGSLTDVEDEEVTVSPEATIRLAHTCTLEEITPWKEHFADYEVVPLVDQFRSGSYQLPKDKDTATELKDFEGYLLEAFQLRGFASKQGYTRGETEDGGWFYTYRKSFQGLGLDAVINFSGNYLPEENNTVALTTLTFEKNRPEQTSYSYYGQPKVELKDVPQVLLSEIWHDMQAMSALGSGYDADWQKKVDY